MDPEDPDSDLDHSQNRIFSFFYLFRHILKISSKSVHKFLSYLVHKQTHKLTNPQTNPDENITSLAEVIIMLSEKFYSYSKYAMGNSSKYMKSDTVGHTLRQNNKNLW